VQSSSEMSLRTNQHLSFTGRMPFLSPNQHCQSTEGKILGSYFQICLQQRRSGKFLHCKQIPDIRYHYTWTHTHTKSRCYSDVILKLYYRIVEQKIDKKQFGQKLLTDHTRTEVLDILPRKRPAFWPKLTKCL